jgi:hypothetical protein
MISDVSMLKNLQGNGKCWNEDELRVATKDREVHYLNPGRGEVHSAMKPTIMADGRIWTLDRATGFKLLAETH